MVKLGRSTPCSVLYMTMEFQIKFKCVGKWSTSWKELRVIILPFYSNCSAVHSIKHCTSQDANSTPLVRYQIWLAYLWGIQNHPAIAYIKKSIAWTSTTAKQFFWKYFLHPYFIHGINEDFTPPSPPLPYIK